MEYEINQTRGYFSITRGAVFVSSADTYLEARADIEEMERKEGHLAYVQMKQEERQKKRRKRRRIY